MVSQDNPSYRVTFLGGISQKGRGTLHSKWNSHIEDRIFSYAFWDHSLSRPLGRQLTPFGADLVDIGVAIATADRLCLRSPKGDQRSLSRRWPRQIQVEIPVRCVERWRSTEISDSLATLLDHMADEEWIFEFVPRNHHERSSEAQVVLPWKRPSLGESRVILFSGGLDSFTGVANLLGKPLDTIVTVNIANNARIGNQAQSILNKLPHEDRPTLLPATASLRILAPGLEREPSARLRALQFLFAGIAVVDACEGNKLTVCENGYGAINLPMTSDQFGSRAGKGMHPKTLAHISHVVSLAADQPFKTTNLGLFFSKGQLVKQYADAPHLRSLALETQSCERHTYRRHRTSCGICGSCLLRRIAFNAAGKEEPVGRYEVDLQSLARTSTSLQLSAMGYQAAELRGLLSGDDSFMALGAKYPELHQIEAVGSKEVWRASLVSMFQAYLREFDQFSRLLGEQKRAGIDYMMVPERFAIAP